MAAFCKAEYSVKRPGLGIQGMMPTTPVAGSSYEFRVNAWACQVHWYTVGSGDISIEITLILCWRQSKALSLLGWAQNISETTVIMSSATVKSAPSLPTDPRFRMVTDGYLAVGLSGLDSVSGLAHATEAVLRLLTSATVLWLTSIDPSAHCASSDVCSFYMSMSLCKLLSRSHWRSQISVQISGSAYMHVRHKLAIVF